MSKNTNKHKREKRAAGTFKAPFEYDESCTRIVDANGMWCLDIRGWGHLTGGGALNLSQEVAMKLQDDFGKRVVRLLNEEAS